MKFTDYQQFKYGFFVFGESENTADDKRINSPWSCTVMWMKAHATVIHTVHPFFSDII
jgi:hypothetical protein